MLIGAQFILQPYGEDGAEMEARIDLMLQSLMRIL